MKRVLNSLYLQWHITKCCNCRCEHCYQSDYSDSSEMSFEDLVRSFIKYKDFVKFFYESYIEKDKQYLPIIALTGGEPFVRKDFMKFLEVLSTNKDYFFLSILTNGTLITDSIATELKNFGVKHVQISIEGDEQVHDSIRGAGTYKKAVNGIEYLKNAGIDVNLSFTAHKLNYKSFPKVAALGKKFEVNAVWTDRVIPVVKHDKILCLSPEETKEYVDIINKEHNKYKDEKFNVANFRALQSIGTEEEPRLYSCHAGFNNFTLLENGDIYPCRRLPIKVGNIFENSFKDIYLNNPVMKKLREDYYIPPKGCSECNLFEKCHGGLKCLSYATYGDYHVEDPGCWLAKK